MYLEDGATAAKIFKEPVEAVLIGFSVVIGAGIERFLKDHELVKKQRLTGWREQLFYWSALTILVSLAIRFLVGSWVHLHDTYVPLRPDNFPETVKIPDFLKDLFFLFVFGTFLVRAALSRSLSGFMLWLWLFSLTGIFWSLLEYATRRGDPAAIPWLRINAFQFLITFVGWMWFVPRIRAGADEPAANGGASNVRVIVPVALIFAALFCIDLCQLLTVRSPCDCFDEMFHAVARTFRLT